jgi:enoyl-CoA hydratase
MSTRSIEVSTSDRVATVTLIGPGKGNAMGPDFWREFPAAIEELARDAEVRAIVVRGAGDHFTFGLDLMGMMNELGPLVSQASLAKGRTELLRLIRELQRAFDVVEECPTPVIAAIHGWCIGGGVDLSAACDIRIASSEARFSVREVKLAMVADLGSLARLPRIIGQGHTRELAYTGKNIDAERALRIGLVNDVYPSPAALFEAANALAREIADNSPLTVRGIKEVMRFSDGKPPHESLAYVAAWNSAFLPSKDLGEALAAFMEKRKPTFTGE